MCKILLKKTLLKRKYFYLGLIAVVNWNCFLIAFSEVLPSLVVDCYKLRSSNSSQRGPLSPNKSPLPLNTGRESLNPFIRIYIIILWQPDGF